MNTPANALISGMYAVITPFACDELLTDLLLVVLHLDRVFLAFSLKFFRILKKQYAVKQENTNCKPCSLLDVDFPTKCLGRVANRPAPCGTPFRPSFFGFFLDFC